MMEQPKHVCKLCGKSFPSGRSLGGHMRSHISAAAKSSPSAPARTASASGYGLREKRKKPWRFAMSDSTDHVITHNTHAGTNKDSNKNIKRRFCKECGKGFPSRKALFGHMKCHSNKQRQKRRPSSRNNNNVLASYSQDQDSRTTTQSDNINNNNNYHRYLNLKPPQRPRSKRVRISSVDETEEQLMDNVVRCLVFFKMGSPGRSSPSESKNLPDVDVDDDVKEKTNLKFECVTCNKAFPSYQSLGGHRACHKKIAKDCSVPMKDESSENNDCVKADPDDLPALVEEPPVSFFSADDDEIVRCLVMLRMDTTLSISQHESNNLPDVDDSIGDDDDVEVGKRDLNKFECVTCNKVFPSYQSLGGHRASHKKIAKYCFVPMVDESSENNCVKADSDLPALVDEPPVEKKRKWIDLNLPPPDDVEEEEDSKNNNSNSECFTSSQLPCRVTSIPNKQELPVGLISN